MFLFIFTNFNAAKNLSWECYKWCHHNLTFVKESISKSQPRLEAHVEENTRDMCSGGVESCGAFW